VKKLVDAGTIPAGAVEHEVKIGGDAETERIGKLMANVADRIIESRDALILLALVAFDGDIDSRGFAAGRHEHFIDGDQPDTRIGKLSGNDDDEFFLDGLDEAILMMLSTTIFQEQYS